ncbi:MAG: hypothetical protein N0E48_17315 [Candidatus Thiodiazotropha endolucinida]|nr:hypothetical protein [Candidatus Thiodiazotropha taylori]MCW4345093.1 hypothetical protein [Candidatus Thiodiazotropha endolucinida]
MTFYGGQNFWQALMVALPSLISSLLSVSLQMLAMKQLVAPLGSTGFILTGIETYQLHHPFISMKKKHWQWFLLPNAGLLGGVTNI